MRLTLLRHAKAVDREEWKSDDAKRPCTKEGLREARAVFKALRPLVKADAVLASPILRARTTAELVAGIWELPLRIAPWLAAEAGTTPERAAQLRSQENLVLVGHEPDLGDLAGYLIGGRGLQLKKSGVCILDGQPVPGGMELRGLFAPRHILALAEG